jgi:hypothetical protein
MPLVLFGGGKYAVLEVQESWMADNEDDQVVRNWIKRFI